MADPTALGTEEFAAAMAEVGPFEPCPHLAVAVSGGADSLALCLLAHRWAGARGGRVSALTVDHGLRPGSRAEADRVGDWLAGRGIAHEVLAWTGDKPVTGIQQAARTARYRLMSQWCADAGVLHLLVAHHQGDQAETVLMRWSRGSGVDGLAGMGAVVEMAKVRLVRPLLTTQPPRLRALLRAAGQPWIEDPSNSDPVYTRTRIRAALPRVPQSADAVSTVMEISRRSAVARMALDAAASTLLARCCLLFAEGYARLHAPTLASAPPAVSTRAFGGLLTVIAGRAHAPAVDKLERIVSRLFNEHSLSAATLGRCRLARTGDIVLVCREERGLPAPRVPPADAAVHWDGRFEMHFAWSSDACAAGIRLVALGTVGARRLAAGGHPPSGPRRIPREVWPALPALADDKGIVLVPHLGYRRPAAGSPPIEVRSLLFRPARPLTGSGRYLA